MLIYNPVPTIFVGKYIGYRFNNIISIVSLLLVLSMIILQSPTQVRSNTIDRSIGINQTDDQTAPVLNVISPEPTDEYNESTVHIVLEVRDETSWKSVTITLGNIEIFRFIKDMNMQNQTNLIQSAKYLFLDKTISIANRQKLSNNIFKIIASDAANNTDSFSLTVVRDIEKPIIKWNQPVPLQLYNNRDITLNWSVIDQSEIIIQTVSIDGISYSPKIQKIADYYISQITLPSSIQIYQNYTISVVAIDAFDNTGNNKIKVTLLTETNVNSQNVGGGENLGNDFLLTILITILSISLILSLFLIFGRGKKGSDAGKWKGRISDPPLTELKEIQKKKYPDKVQIIDEVFQELERNWKVKREEFFGRDHKLLDVRNFIDQFIDELTLELIAKTELDAQTFVMMEKYLTEWKELLLYNP